MRRRVDIRGTFRSVIGGIFGVTGYALRFFWLMLIPKASLAAKLLATESQLAACVDAVERKKAPRPRFTVAFRLLWVALRKWLPDWRTLARVVRPATVVGWHRRVAKLLWRWKSRPGRPKISREMQALIRRLSTENPLWGAERIREELVKLQYDAPCEDTVRRYMAKPVEPREPSSTWLPFLRNHLPVAWAIDFFTVTTLTFKTVYVFVVLEHGRRVVRHWATTPRPTMSWVIQQLRTAMPYGEQPRFLHRDNDGVYGDGVHEFLTRYGIEDVPTAPYSPWQNPFVERFIGTLRRELLDHVIPLSERHLERLLHEFIHDYYHGERPHQGLDGETPAPRDQPPDVFGPTKLVSIPVLGGLHHTYRRVSA